MNFVKNSMIQTEIQTELDILHQSLSKKEEQVEISNLFASNVETPLDVATRYIACLDEKKSSINKSKIKCRRN